MCHIKETVSADELEVRDINITEWLPVSRVTKELVEEATSRDKTLQDVQQMIQHGWPAEKNRVPGHLRQYYNVKDELTIRDGLVLKGERLCVPEAAKQKLKERLHSSHILLRPERNLATVRT